MRYTLVLLLIWVGVATSTFAETNLSDRPSPIDFEFGGYRFGQAPSANMDCASGFCKSQAPGGDGVITYPFSVYKTPGDVSTQIGMTVVNSRYTFWEDQLYRIGFQVDCTPQPTEECLDDLIKSLDREYDLTPLTKSDWQQFASGKRSVAWEFVSGERVIIRIRAACNDDVWTLPFVDIVDKSMADRVGTTLSPYFKPKQLQLPESNGP